MREILGLSGSNCNTYQMHIRISLMLYGLLAGQLVQQPLRQLPAQRAIRWNNARVQICNSAITQRQELTHAGSANRASCSAISHCSLSALA